MVKKNGLFRLKIEFDNVPVTDAKFNSINEMDNVFKNIKKKFKGGF